MQVWSRAAVGPGDEPMEVYGLDNAAIIDLYKYDGFPQLRANLRLWQASISDAQGCVHLASPQALAPTVGILDDACPELLVLEHAASLGGLLAFRRMTY